MSRRWSLSSFLKLVVVASSLTVGAVWLAGPRVQPSAAVQLGDGRIAFNSPPLLVGHSVTPSDTGARNATFRFAITLPENAGEPLSYVEIVPSSGPEGIDFRLNNITAYAGDGLRRGDDIPVIGRSLDADPSDTRAESIGVQFEPALAPGQTVTIALKSLRNPSFGGAFAYEVRAYPDMNVGVGHRMGLARFTIFTGGGCDRIRC